MRWDKIVEQEDYEDTQRVEAFDMYLAEKGKLRASEMKEGEEANETCGA